MQWFVVTEDEQLGPFDEVELKRLFESGEFSDSTEVWREGWDKAKKYKDIFLETPEDDLPPEIPPIPLDALEKAKKQRKIPTQEEVKAPLEQLSEEENRDNSPNTHLNEELHLDISEPEVDEETPQGSEAFSSTSSIKQKFKRLILFSAVVSVVMGLGYGLFYYEQQRFFSRPKLMSFGDYEKLRQMKDLNVKRNVFAAVLAKDKRSIWFGTNNPYYGEVLIKAKSIPGRVLGEPVEFNAVGTLEDYLIELTKIQFDKGSRFIDGYYNVEITTSNILEGRFYFDYFFAAPKTINFKARILISNLNERDFKRQLAKYLQAKAQNSQSYWEEIIEKYKTVKMITGQIRDGFVAIFSFTKTNWNQKVTEFEKQYKQNWGQFFTAFVKANEASYKKIANKDFQNSEKVLASYNHLSRLAIKIGEESMKVLAALEQMNTKNQNHINSEIKKNILKELNLIIDACETEVKQLTTSQSRL